MFDALSRYERESGGWPASVRMICAFVGNASPSPVHRHLDSLCRKGIVERHPDNRQGGFRIRRNGDGT